MNGIELVVSQQEELSLIESLPCVGDSAPEAGVESGAAFQKTEMKSGIRFDVSSQTGSRGGLEGEQRMKDGLNEHSTGRASEDLSK